MLDLKELIPLFETLVSENVSSTSFDLQEISAINRKGVGYSQFNEIMLLLGFNRISKPFFQFLVDGTLVYKPGSEIESIEGMKRSIDRFRELALLWFGNTKFAFKILSTNETELTKRVNARIPFSENDFKLRHDPINVIEYIPPEIAYLFGYYVTSDLEGKMKRSPEDKSLKELWQQREKYILTAQKNQISYLTSDHLDVYVATSMREKHEFFFVNKLISEVFNHAAVRNLKLRCFDPTQAYCKEREDKGLSEALMLRRATCTVYLVQENDSFGKDSELASTLAQGKPVIAFVPNGDKLYVDALIKNLKTSHSDKIEKQLILEQLSVFDVSLAWKNEKVKFWVNNLDEAKVEEMMELLYEVVEYKYNDRAQKLKEEHPLGIQVNLESGVANGVLVVRTVNDCATLLYAIVTNTLEFNISPKVKDLGEYLYLYEKISKSIFRIQTADKMLTNSFWNFYLNS